MIHTGGQTGPRWRTSLGKSGPKIPVFAFSFTYLLYVLVHVFFSLSHRQNASIGRTKETEDFSLVLFLRLPLCEGRGGRVKIPGALFDREGRMGFGRDSMDNRKLEDLVRLALKRLNVSYLTIMSRLVWFQREMPCVSRTWTQEKLVFSNLQTIKLYLIIII